MQGRTVWQGIECKGKLSQCCAGAVCRGPLGWLVPAEVQPLETRAAGTGINTFFNFMLTFVIGQVGTHDCWDQRVSYMSTPDLLGALLALFLCPLRSTFTDNTF